MDLTQLLREKFHHDQFRPGQQEIIETILNGESVLGMLPTGTGKSLCYQLPGYLIDGTVIIISPLISLMEDQVAQLQRLGEKRAVALNSLLSSWEKQWILSEIHHYKFIFMSPENDEYTHHLLHITKLLDLADHLYRHDQPLVNSSLANLANHNELQSEYFLC